MPSGAPSILGAKAVVEWFGEWPSFHDAEVVEIHLDRGGPSRVRMNVRTRDGDARGADAGAGCAVVTFRLGKVRDLELADFSCQNVISSLGLAAGADGHSYRITLGPCYGVAGWIEAEDVSVAVSPGRPEAGRA